MKRLHLLFFIAILLTSLGASAQPLTYKLNLKATLLKNIKEFKKGSELTFTEFGYETIVRNDFQYDSYYLKEANGKHIKLPKRIEDTFEFHYENVQDFWDVYYLTSTINPRKVEDYQYELRKDMENKALEYIYGIKERNLELKDLYLESYIYSLAHKILPNNILSGKPCHINILIQENPSINAATYPNGTIVINTGLLANLHSEDELVAVLAHEISHFLLDHSIMNVNKEQQRIQRAKIWGGILTAATAVAEGVAANRSDYYVPGAATLGVAALSTLAADRVIDLLGMKYNYNQEIEADEIAVKILDLLGYNKNALATLLDRFQNHYELEYNPAATLVSHTHPSLSDRIQACGEPTNLYSRNFEQMVSFAITSLGRMYYMDKHFKECMDWVSLNIKNNVATADDYILKARCLLATENTMESNLEVLNLIDKAKATGTRSFINMFSTQVVANLRLNRTDVAKDLLWDYMVVLHNLNDSIRYENKELWEYTREFTNTEADWAERMLVKLKGMYEDYPPTKQ